MFNIDIERLIDAVAAYNEAYNDYAHSAKTIYRGSFETIGERKHHLEYAREVSDREQSAVYTLIEVFQLDKEAQARLYSAARAVNRWRIRTEWARLIPDDMKKQIERFIFGPPSAPSMVCERCGCWRA